MADFEPPEGFFPVRNPNYPQDTLFEEGNRRRAISTDEGIDAIWSPLASDGVMKVKWVLFDESLWPSESVARAWISENRNALKFLGADGRSRVLTAHKQLAVQVSKDFGPVPGDADLALINGVAIEPQKAEQVYVRRERLANTQVDRAGERFTNANIRQFAKSIVGKAKLAGHNYQGLPEGRFYKATTENTNGVMHVVPSFYMIRTDASAPIIANIDGGVLKDVSIGFNFETLQCDICGRNYLDFWGGDVCPHYALQTYPVDDLVNFDRGGFEPEVSGGEVLATVNYGAGKVEALEGSIVWLGCQYDAEMVKAIQPGANVHEAKRLELERAGHEEGGHETFYSLPVKASDQTVNVKWEDLREFALGTEEPEDATADPAPGEDKADTSNAQEVTPMPEDDALQQRFETAQKDLQEAGEKIKALERAVNESALNAETMTTAYGVLRDSVVAELENYADLLERKAAFDLFAEATEGWEKCSPEKMVAMRNEWKADYEKTLPPRQQSKQEDPEAPETEAPTDEPDPSEATLAATRKVEL